jgi:hypothetical protein
MTDPATEGITEEDLRDALDYLSRDRPRGNHCIHAWEAIAGKSAAAWLQEHFPPCVEPCHHQKAR